MATTSAPFSIAALKTKRPMRPKPLIPILVGPEPGRGRTGALVLHSCPGGSGFFSAGAAGLALPKHSSSHLLIMYLMILLNRYYLTEFFRVMKVEAIISINEVAVDSYGKIFCLKFRIKRNKLGVPEHTGTWGFFPRMMADTSILFQLKRVHYTRRLGLFRVLCLAIGRRACK